MKRLSDILRKTTASTLIAYLWTISSILMFMGVGHVSDQVLEKIFSIDMIVLSYYYANKSKEKSSNSDDELISKSEC